MSQNRSSAVMQQRAEPHDSLDDFPTQPWGTRALLRHVIPEAASVGRSVWEPACNRGFMSRPLSEFFATVRASDVHDYGIVQGAEQMDFLFPVKQPLHDWIITNPPFRLAEQFITRARHLSKIGCAMLVRTSFLEGVTRWRSIFSLNPPTLSAQFSERLPMVKGRCDPKASTATSYMWLVWMHNVERQPLQWIPPCRKSLERDSDYEIAS
jgi:hypothetical protein